MKLTLDSKSPVESARACIVIGIFEDAKLPATTASLDAASDGAINRLVESGDIRGGLGKTAFIHGLAGIAADRILAVGLGKADKLTLARFDRACLAAGKVLRDHPLRECHVHLHEAEVDGVDVARRLRQAALAIHRANYLYTTTKPLKDDSPVPLHEASFQGGPHLQQAIDQAAAMAAGFDKAKQLGDLPANICNPAYLAQEAATIAERYEQVELEVLEEADMARLGMDALLAVSRGSSNDAKLIVLSYNGAGPSRKPFVLIGKGITFDSGGLSLKSGEHMMQMKYDMCGAAGVLGAPTPRVLG